MLDKPETSDQQGVRDFLTEGVTTLSAVEMNRVLQVCAYKHQRPISEQHVEVLMDLMARGKWQPKSQIDFAVVGGNYILVNGYHRAYAQVRSGKKIAWNIALHQVGGEREIRNLYYMFDTNVRTRGTRDILSAYEFAETAGLTGVVSDALYRAVPFIANAFELSPAKKDFLTAKAVDRRLTVAQDYAKAAGRYEACLTGVLSGRKKQLLGAAVMAVALVTFRYQGETAWQFWTGVAQNDGLKRGDPRHAFVMDLMSRKRNGGSVYSFGPAMVAWNAFFNERPLQLIKVMPDTFTPAIDGTPFDGKRAKAK